MKDYKDTLNLPKTDLAMKANLPNKEPELLKYWEKIDLYKKLKEKGQGRKKFILHDGPHMPMGPFILAMPSIKLLKT